MKRWTILIVGVICLSCWPGPGFGQDQCPDIWENITFMQQLAAGFKGEAESRDNNAAVGDRMNGLIGFLRQVDQQEENNSLAKSLSKLEKVWMNQSFDATNREDLCQALDEAAAELEKIYNARCKL